MWDANHNPADYEENLGRGVNIHSVCAIFAERTTNDSSCCMRGAGTQGLTRITAGQDHCDDVDAIYPQGVGRRR